MNVILCRLLIFQCLLSSSRYIILLGVGISVPGYETTMDSPIYCLQMFIYLLDRRFTSPPKDGMSKTLIKSLGRLLGLNSRPWSQGLGIPKRLLAHVTTPHMALGSSCVWQLIIETPFNKIPTSSLVHYARNQHDFFL